MAELPFHLLEAMASQAEQRRYNTPRRTNISSRSKSLVTLGTFKSERGSRTYGSTSAQSSSKR